MPKKAPASKLSKDKDTRSKGRVEKKGDLRKNVEVHGQKEKQHDKGASSSGPKKDVRMKSPPKLNDATAGSAPRAFEWQTYGPRLPVFDYNVQLKQHCVITQGSDGKIQKLLDANTGATHHF